MIFLVLIQLIVNDPCRDREWAHQIAHLCYEILNVFEFIKECDHVDTLGNKHILHRIKIKSIVETHYKSAFIFFTTVYESCKWYACSKNKRNTNSEPYTKEYLQSMFFKFRATYQTFKNEAIHAINTFIKDNGSLTKLETDTVFFYYLLEAYINVLEVNILTNPQLLRTKPVNQKRD